MYTKDSREPIKAVLQANRWVVLFQIEDPLHDPVQEYHNIAFRINAHGNNGANCEIVVQDSPDGSVWTTRYTHPTPLRPGGFLNVDCHFLQNYARCLVFCTQPHASSSRLGGTVEGTYHRPEVQVTPRLIPAEGVSVACSVYCEVACETAGAE